MAKSEEEIKSDIKQWIRKHGGAYAAWYVGVSKDARRRLFDEHGVHEKDDWWIYRQAASSAIARDIESYFVNELGTDGGAGGGEQDADYAYAYKKSAHTNP